MWIKSLRNTSASGVSIAQADILSVPGQISREDAQTLIKMGKAVEIPEPPKPQPAPEEEAPSDMPKRRRKQ